MWHIAAFRCAVEFDRYRGHGGHRASRAHQVRFMSTRPGICRRGAASDLPDGQISDRAIQPRLQKYSCFHLSQISLRTPPSRSREEGRIAIVTDVGHGMRWTRQRRVRDVIAERSQGARTNDIAADGKAVWSWRPDAGVKFRGNLAQRRWQQSPVTGYGIHTSQKATLLQWVTQMPP